MKTLLNINVSFFLEKKFNTQRDSWPLLIIVVQKDKISDKGREINAFSLLLKHRERSDLENNRTYFSDIV